MTNLCLIPQRKVGVLLKLLEICRRELGDEVEFFTTCMSGLRPT